MPAIHIYNPDTDYALAFMGKIYSPPASIIRLRRQGALFPATYAREDDVILLLDDFSPTELESSIHHPMAREKNIIIININKGFENAVATITAAYPLNDIEVCPWGWNLSLRNTLIRKGMPELLLKSELEIDRIRSLSHRRKTIPFQQELMALLPRLGVKIAMEFFNEEDVWRFAAQQPGAYFKMPWSSAGRGVVCRKNMTDLKFREWIHGAIIRQGSVLGEFGYDRAIDFATEWVCRKGEVIFIGLSLFHTSSNGTYISNRVLSQEEIFAVIKSHSPLWDWNVIEAQREVIKKLISPFYDGPLGIDMLADKKGSINPCVEINLRMTMGMATILANSLNNVNKYEQ
ncbi:MAG: hypothetical protein HDR88_05360 [Bacteroides sp.]|nr:hypothetical protein [Bacteroides sp.]